MMRRWMIGLLIAALMSGMTCGIAEEGEPAPEPATAAEAAPAPEPEPDPAPVPAQEAPKEEPKAEVKSEPKEEPKEEKKEEPKEEKKEEPKEEKKEAPKAETKAETKSEPKAETKTETKSEPKEEAKTEAKSETKAEEKAEVNQEPKAEAPAEEKAEPKEEQKEEPKEEANSADDEAAESEVRDDDPQAPEAADTAEAEPEVPTEPDELDEQDAGAIEADGEEFVRNEAMAAEDIDPADNGEDTGEGSDPETTDPETTDPDTTDPETTNPEDGQPEVTEGEGPDYPVEEGETEEEGSETVRQIQGWLVALGYLSDDQVTGVYDSPTIRAVKSFQSANGLAATGKCTGDTYDLLKAKATGTYTEPTATPETTTAPETVEAPAETPPESPATPPEGQENPENSQQNPNVKRGKMPGKGGFGGGRSGGTGSGAEGKGEIEDDGLNGITPGEALTSTHSSGDRDETLYGAMDIEADLYALDFEADGGEPYEYEYVIDAGRLTLSGGNRWTFTGKSLRALNRSGVRQLVLAGSRGVTLDTGLQFTGAAYEALRARGYTDNTFEYDVDTAAGEITVAAGGGRYMLNAAGELIPAEQ